MGPKSGEGRPIGGNSLFEGSVELRYPIWKWISGFYFIDFGNVWRPILSYEFGQLRFAGGLNFSRIQGNLLKSFEISDISLTGADDTVLTISRLAVNLLPQRLLKKKIVIRVVEIDSLHLLLRQLPDSSWNVAHLLKSTSKSEKDTASKSSSIGWQLLLEDVNLNGVSVFIEPVMDLSFLPRRIENINTHISLAYNDSGLAINLRKLRLKTQQLQFIVDEWSCFASLKENVMKVQDLTFQTNRSKLTGEGFFHFTRQPVYEIFLKGSPLAFADVKEILPNLPLYGTPDVNLNVAIGGDSLFFELDVEEDVQQIGFTGVTGTINKKPEFDVQGKIKNLNLGHWFNKPEMASSINGRIIASGGGNIESKNNLQFSLRLRDLSRLKPHLKADSLNANGYLSGHICGRPDSLIADIEYEIANFIYDAVQFDSLGGTALVFYGQDSLNGHADAKILKNKISAFRIDTLSVNAEFTKNIFDTQVNFSHADTLDGQIHSIFTADSLPRITLLNVKMNIGKRHWEGGSDSMQVILGQGYYQFENVCVSSNEQYILVDGVFTLDGGENL